MTETEKIRSITMDDFKKDSHLIDYIDENIIVLDNVDNDFVRKGIFRLDCFLLVFCLEGKTQICINGKQCTLEAEHCAILLPNTIVSRMENKHSCNIRIVAISFKFLKELSHVKKETWDVAFYLYHNPVFPINRESSYRFYLYKELALACINEKPRPFLKETKQHIFSAIFCELLSKLHESIPVQNNLPSLQNDRSSSIFRQFMKKVSKDDGTHRSVTYYANSLCYSAKHLSTVVKKICGKAPLTIINEHAMDCIKYELRHSDKSIKEIADQFEFVNPSFFGKFVKAHTGMTPMQYRMYKEKE